MKRRVRTIQAADALLRRRSRAFVIALALGLVLAIGAIDHLTGYDFGFGVFYLIPVSLGSWYVSGRSGIVLSALSATVWFLANAFTGRGQELFPVIVSWNAITRLLFFLTVSTLLASLAAAFEHERELARTDHLTGVTNSRAFRERAARELSRTKRRHLPVSLVYLDLDNFKEVNDRYGHGAGDALLERVGAALMKNLRTTDVVGRLGGDEFAILLPETGQHEARLVAEKIQGLIAADLEVRELPVTASIGVVTSPETQGDVAHLIQVADRLMYAVKRGGKGGIHFALLEVEAAAAEAAPQSGLGRTDPPAEEVSSRDESA